MSAANIASALPQGAFLGEILPTPVKDVVSLMAGHAPNSVKRRSAADSSKAVDYLLSCWQILPSFSDKLVKGPIKKILLPVDYRRLCNARLAVIAFQKTQIAGCRPLLATLEHSEINYSLLKGAASGCILYPERYMRTSWDFDLAVSWEDLPTVEAMALEAGFHQAQRITESALFCPANRQLRDIVEKDHYELGFLVRRLQVTNLSPETLDAIRTETWTHQFWHDVDSVNPFCYAAVDIHHAMSLDIGFGELLTSARSVSIDNETLRVPSDAWFAAHLVYKLYWEGVHNYAKGLYQYADLVRLVARLDEDTFVELIDILEKYNLIAAGYHSFKHLPKFGVELPEHIASFISDTQYPPEDGDPTGLNDLGDVWPKLWGLR